MTKCAECGQHTGANRRLCRECSLERRHGTTIGAEDTTTSALEALVEDVAERADEDLTAAALTGRVCARTDLDADLAEVYEAAQALTTGEDGPTTREGGVEGGEAA